MSTLLNENRFDMAKLFYGIGVEVGVADGTYANAILGTNPNVVKLYGVDPYAPYRGYTDYTRGTTFNKMHAHAEERLAQFGDRHEFIFKLSMDAVKDFEDSFLDFVYIDANHSYATCLEDISAWTPKVKKGGFVCGDDYTRSVKPGNQVIQAVNDYVKWHDIPELMVYGEGRNPTNWMFIKP